MSDNTKDELVVQAGSVTVLTQVGAGMAYVDFPQGATLPADLSNEDRDRLTRSNAIGKRDGGGEYINAARPVPGEVEPDEIPADIIPGGTVDAIMAWVGDDLARARVARHEEMAKGDKARATLLKKLDEVKVAEETEPPSVPEFYREDTTVSPVAVGGVVTPSDNPSEGEGKPAVEVASPNPSRARRSN